MSKNLYHVHDCETCGHWTPCTDAGHPWEHAADCETCGAVIATIARPVDEPELCTYCDAVPLTNGGPYCDGCLANFYGSHPCHACGATVAGWPVTCPSCSAEQLDA